MRTLCSGKIHRATITETQLEYVGSVTISKDLMDAANIKEYEQVHILNLNNGERWITYALAGPLHSGVICVNGAASRLAQQGDLIIILSYQLYAEEQLKSFVPRHVYVDERNRIIGDCETLREQECGRVEEVG